MDTQNYNPVNSGRGRGGRHRNHGHQQPGRHHHHHHHANHSGRGPRHERHNSVAGIRQYHDRLHPVIAQRYRNLKAKALRLQTGFQEILDCIEELIPSDEHMDWSFSPGTIVYVPVPHPSVNTLSKRVSSVSLTSTSSQISSNHHQDAIQSRSSLAAPGSLSNQPQTSESHTQPTINHHPVQSELVSTNDGYYPSWPPITVPLQSRDHTGTMPTAQVPLTSMSAIPLVNKLTD
jgi:hypothetical protein